jgi:hypothetical protein
MRRRLRCRVRTCGLIPHVRLRRRLGAGGWKEP